ncbi:T9SS type A sorting domain-containing protein [Candidatus Fermentibacteria bacterium]|nr:T9SS type A sorting domain-containing protein [Candidatus Fermentibacteria bacterium]
MRIVTLLALLAVYSALAGSMSLDLSFDPSDLDILNRAGYQRLIQKGCVPWGEPGEPLLPHRIVSLVVPPDACNLRVSVESKTTESLPGSYRVQPVAVPRPIGLRAAGPAVLHGDPSIYRRSAPWPEATVGRVHSGRKGGFGIVSFVVCPYSYLPSTGELFLHREIVLNVDWDSDHRGPTLCARQIDAAAGQLEHWVDNPLDLERYRPPSRGFYRDFDYLVVTSEDYSDSFSYYVDYKNDAGVLTDLAYVENILSSSPGWDDAEKLRNYIIDRYQNDGIQHVLLAGDENVLPTREVYLECEGYSDNASCDLYFSDLDGTWDANGDHDYGQPGDSLDLYADVSVGRALFSDADEAAVFVTRSIMYDDHPPAGDWQSRAMLCGAGLFSGYTGAKVCDSIAARLPGDWEINKAYEPAMSDGFTTHIDVIESGTNWNHYAGHGNDYGVYWQTSPTDMMTNSIARDLSNGDKAGFHHSIGCMPGSFHHSYDCCADALLHNAGGGAVSVMFNSSYGWEGYLPEMGVSEWMCVYLTEEVFQLYNNLIGPAFATSKDRRVPLWSGGRDRELYCIMCWNAYHDPTLRVLSSETGTPPERNAVAPAFSGYLGRPAPNPARSGETVSFRVVSPSGDATVRVYDLAGRVVWEAAAPGEELGIWDLTDSSGSPVSPGVYFVGLSTRGPDAYRKLVVMP